MSDWVCKIFTCFDAGGGADGCADDCDTVVPFSSADVCAADFFVSSKSFFFASNSLCFASNSLCFVSNSLCFVSNSLCFVSNCECDVPFSVFIFCNIVSYSALIFVKSILSIKSIPDFFFFVSCNGKFVEIHAFGYISSISVSPLLILLIYISIFFIFAKH